MIDKSLNRLSTPQAAHVRQTRRENPDSHLAWLDFEVNFFSFEMKADFGFYFHGYIIESLRLRDENILNFRHGLA